MVAKENAKATPIYQIFFFFLTSLQFHVAQHLNVIIEKYRVSKLIWLFFPLNTH
jgi:hypothetical protein